MYSRPTRGDVNILNFNFFINSIHRNQSIGLDFRILIKADLNACGRFMNLRLAYKWLTSKLYWSAVGNE